MGDDVKLPGLEPVVLPRAMREPPKLGSRAAPGDCVGALCASGGLHFSVKPLAWHAAPRLPMPAPGEMPTAAPLEQGGMPALAWSSRPARGAWHHADEHAAPDQRTQATTLQADVDHARQALQADATTLRWQQQARSEAAARLSLRQQAAAQRRPTDAGPQAPVSASSALVAQPTPAWSTLSAMVKPPPLHVSRAAADAMRVGGAPAPTKMPIEAASHTKAQAVQHLAQKLTRQIALTDSHPSISDFRPKAGPVPGPASQGGAPPATGTGSTGVLHKLAGAAHQSPAAGPAPAHRRSLSGSSALASNHTLGGVLPLADFHHGNWAAIGSAAATSAKAAGRDVVAAGGRVEHRLNPYDAPVVVQETPYGWALEASVVVFWLLLVVAACWMVYKHCWLDGQDAPRKSDYMAIVGDPVARVHQGLEEGGAGIKAMMEKTLAPAPWADAAEAREIKTDIAEIKGAISAIAGRMKQADEHAINTDRRLAELRADLDTALASRASGAAAGRQHSGRRIPSGRFLRELESLGLGDDDDTPARTGLYSFVR